MIRLPAVEGNKCAGGRGDLARGSAHFISGIMIGVFSQRLEEELGIIQAADRDL